MAPTSAARFSSALWSCPGALQTLEASGDHNNYLLSAVIELSRAIRRVPIKEGFRPGPRGACEVHLFAFHRFVPDEGAAEGEPRLIAAVSLLEAVMFLKRDTPDFSIRAVEHRGVILMLSGSPYE